MRAAVSSSRTRTLGQIVGMVAVVALLFGCSGGGSAPTVSVSVDPSSSATGVSVRTLIFGDSYTEGYGAEPVTDGYAYQVGPAMGWDVTVDGVGGTGYVNPGFGDGTFVQRLASSTYPSDFDVVIIEGGTNDVASAAVSAGGLASAASAIDQTFTAFESRFPLAEVVVLGLFNWDAPAPTPAELDVNSALSVAAASHGFEFVDSLGEQWFTVDDQSTLINPANDHPNAAGYAVMATRLAADLRTHGVAQSD